MEASVYPNQPETLQETVALLERAYLYAYPLVLMGVIKDRTTNVVVPDAEHAPINQLFHAQALATPDMVSLTRPNVDTVYSQAYLDLGAEPILLYKPATDRYCSIQTFDGYSNTPVVLGTGGVGGSDTATYAFVGPFWSGELPQGVTKVSMPTNFVWLLLRTKCFGVDDLPGVREVQQGMRMYPLSAHALDEGAGYACPKGSYDPAYDYVPLEFMQRLSVQDFFTRFNGLASGNPGALRTPGAGAIRNRRHRRRVDVRHRCLWGKALPRRLRICRRFWIAISRRLMPAPPFRTAGCLWTIAWARSAPITRTVLWWRSAGSPIL